MKDLTGKILSNSKNKLNNAKAVLLALSPISVKYSKPSLESAVAPEEIVPAPSLLKVALKGKEE